MLVAILSFTAEGEKKSRQIAAFFEKNGCEVVREHFGKAEDAPRKTTAADFVCRMFPQARLLVFVGACGIAVRLIAPHVRDKKTDPAVLAVDESGRFVIPILSGHLGGANRWARWLAEKLGATAVITTATDLKGRFAPDLFAEKYRLKIRDMKDAKDVAAAGLERDVKIVFDVPCEGKLPPEQGAFCEYRCAPCQESREKDTTKREKNDCGGKEDPGSDAPPSVLVSNAEKAEHTDAPQCVLTPANLTVGIGCRRGIEAEKIISFIKEVFEQNNLSTDAILGLASIDRKRGEPGLIAAAEAFRVPFYTYSAEELNSLRGSFTASEFVKRQMGTDNVCERSAAMAGEKKKEIPSGRFLVRKQARDGVTLAVYEIPVRLTGRSF